MLSFKEYSESKEIKTNYDILKKTLDPTKIEAARRLGLITPKEHKELLDLSRK